MALSRSDAVPALPVHIGKNADSTVSASPSPKLIACQGATTSPESTPACPQVAAASARRSRRSGDLKVVVPPAVAAPRPGALASHERDPERPGSP